jgi:ATP-dependent protease Clp ATPase subunit
MKISIPREAKADDFINFGLLPELIGRSPIRTFVNLLSKNDLIRIMQETEDSFLNQYKMEYKIELILDEEVQNYFEEYAQRNNIQISETLKKFLSGASALNYMGVKGAYKITKEIAEDEKYFDKLFARWYEEQKKKTT